MLHNWKLTLKPFKTFWKLLKFKDVLLIFAENFFEKFIFQSCPSCPPPTNKTLATALVSSSCCSLRAVPSSRFWRCCSSGWRADEQSRKLSRWRTACTLMPAPSQRSIFTILVDWVGNRWHRRTASSPGACASGWGRFLIVTSRPAGYLWRRLRHSFRVMRTVLHASYRRRIALSFVRSYFTRSSSISITC